MYLVKTTKLRFNTKFNGGLVDFLFPFKKKLRIEAVTAADTTGNLEREFFTFRAFIRHCWDELFSETRKMVLFYEGQWMLHPQRGAIAFDTATGQRETVGSTTMSFSYTASGSSRGLVGVIGIQDSAAPAGSTTVSAWTYGGETLAAQNDITNSVLEHIIQWTKSGPLSGANTLAITLSRSVTFRMQAISLSGTNGTIDVKGTLDAGTPASGAAYGGSITTTVANTLSISSSMLGNSSGDNSLITVTTDAQTLADNGTTATSEYSVGIAYKNHAITGAKSLQHTNADADARRAVWAALAWQEGTQVTNVVIAESGAGTDSLKTHKTLPIGDSGVGSDALLTHKTLRISETGTGADVSLIHKTLKILESALGIDTIRVQVLKIIRNVLMRATGVDPKGSAKSIDPTGSAKEDKANT